MTNTLIGGCNNGGGSSTTTASQTLFCGLGTVLLSFNVSTESQVQVKCADAGTFSQLASIVQTNSRSTATTIRFRVAAASVNESVSCTANTTGTFTDTVDTDVITAGALCNYAQITGTGTGTFLCNAVSNNFAGGFGAPMTATAFNGNTGYFRGTSFWPPGTDLNTNGGQGSTTENSGMAQRMKACTLSLFFAIWPTNGINGTSTPRPRIALANGNSSVSIGASATGTFVDSVDTDAITDNQSLDWQVTTAGSSGTASPIFAYGAWLESASGGKQNLAVGWQSGVSTGGAGTNNFLPVMGTVAGTSTEANAQIAVGGAAKWTNLRILVASSPGATVTYKSRIGGVNGNQSLSFSAGGTFEDTTDTDVLAAGNLICTNIATGSSTGFQYNGATSQLSASGTNYDLFVPFEARLTARNDPAAPLMAGGGLGVDGKAPLQSVSNLALDYKVPSETLLVVRYDGALPFEARVNPSDARVPISFGGGVGASLVGSVPLAAFSNEQFDSKLPFEGRFTTRYDGAVPFLFELGVFIEVSGAVPYAFKSTLATNYDNFIPFSFASSVRYDALVPDSITLTVRTDIAAPLAPLSNIARDLLTPIESASSLRFDSFAPLQAQLSYRGDSVVLTSFGLSVIKDGLSPLQSAGSFRSDAAVPFVFAGSVFKIDGAVPFAFQLRLVSDAIVPESSALSIRLDSAVPTTSRLSTRFDSSVPDVFGASLFSGKVPLGYSARFLLDAVVPFSNSLLARFDNIIPFMASSGIHVTFDGLIPLEVRTSVVFDGLVPFGITPGVAREVEPTRPIYWVLQAGIETLTGL